MNWITDNITKLLGTLQTLVAATLGAVALNQIPDLIAQGSPGMQILILANILLGAALTGVGFSNSAKIRVAEAMQTAIKSTPPETK
jgi:hypothetical protein